ncbi:uncharacterized protein EV420DRAFT_1482245 [Desarmillaria tabescens]|uniref:Zn(2)-C6 fungal-type domain-containing protein n=1 Tax=Armillaria tabescens TaxID=1929756 RepID=A0AA39K2C0_ARMTA|nr:uncharacterized protein EV420DRAFT_1482245 [Desarmillaria tabescens]KAK0452160.1 hypothetical protein EV420DRAFT_1482245 [Desarmillaria tabescens]
MSPSTSASKKQSDKAPRRTPMACEFCRGRKMKCDGNRPSCANCQRRQIACTYQPVRVKPELLLNSTSAQYSDKLDVNASILIPYLCHTITPDSVLLRFLSFSRLDIEHDLNHQLFAATSLITGEAFAQTVSPLFGDGEWDMLAGPFWEDWPFEAITKIGYISSELPSPLHTVVPPVTWIWFVIAKAIQLLTLAIINAFIVMSLDVVTFVAQT